MNILTIDYQVLNIQEEHIVLGWSYNGNNNNEEFQLQEYTIDSSEAVSTGIAIPVGNSTTFEIATSQLSTEAFYRLVAVHQISHSVTSDITSMETYYRFGGKGKASW